MAEGKATSLTEATLSEVDSLVATPQYDRRRLNPAIVHLGVGSFHRAHQAVYLDDLARHGSDWGERGVGLLPQDCAMKAALAPQQGLYTLLVRSVDADTARVVGSLLDYLFAPDDPEAVLDALSDARTRLVTLTITEGGYNVDEGTGQFDAGSEAIQSDLWHPHAPTTVFGYLAEALDRRRRRGIGPFSVVSCDNVLSNGHVTRTALVSFARLRDDVLANWIEQHVAFPNSMVDRITPQTTDAERTLLLDEFGLADRWPVVTEPFCQWVLEDHFSAARPALEDVGVQLVADVVPYETMKIRLLNASHVAMGYLASLVGYRTVDAVMADSQFRTFIERQMGEEVAPLLPPVPGIDLDDYQRTLIERFANPRIRDQVSRICLDGPAKMPKFLLPALHDAVAAGRPHRWLTLALAGWLRYLFGTDDHGHEIPVQDAREAQLRVLAVAGRDDPRLLLSQQDIFGDLGTHESFVTELQSCLCELYRAGAAATLARSLSTSRD